MSGFKARDPDYAARVTRSFGGQAMMGTFGAKLLRVEPGEVDIGLPVAPHILQQHGLVHGGAVTTIADSAAGYASLSLLDPGVGILTVELKINLMGPGRGERLVAEGRVVRPGRTLTVAQATVFAEEAGKRQAIALLTATMMRIEGRDGVVD